MNWMKLTLMGASMVKWTKKMLLYLKTIVVANCCLNSIIFHGDLYCCAKYSNVEYKDETFKTFH